MTTNTNTNTPAFSRLALAGAAAEGSGALTGWSGLGSLARAIIIQILIDAGLPVEWAPKSKSDVGYAGNAISSLKNLGFIVRRARGAKWGRTSAYTASTREYRARWIVAANTAVDAEIGAAAGRVVLTAELRDDSDEIHLVGDEALTARVKADFETARDNELYRAGDITSWLRSVLIRHCGAARYAMGYYIPSTGRADAARLVEAVASRWGCNWACPLLPVANSTELRIGIARGFADEVATVARSLQSAREAARKEDKTSEISAAVAARLLRELSDVDGRADAYRVLCGDDALVDAIAQLKTLHAELAPLADDASMRFALLELDVAPVAAPVETASPERVAAAVESRRAEVAEAAPVVEETITKVTTDADLKVLRAIYKAALDRSGLSSNAFRVACTVRLEATSGTPQEWAAMALEVAPLVAAESAQEPTDEAAEPTEPAAEPTEPTDEPTDEPAAVPEPIEPNDSSDRFALIELN